MLPDGAKSGQPATGSWLSALSRQLSARTRVKRQFLAIPSSGGILLLLRNGGAPIKKLQKSAPWRAADMAWSRRFSRVTSIIWRVCRCDFCNLWKRGFCCISAKVDGSTSAAPSTAARRYGLVELSKNRCAGLAGKPDVRSIVQPILTKRDPLAINYFWPLAVGQGRARLPSSRR